MTSNKQKFKAPAIFIVSSGRSGTTLLSSILNASGSVYIPYESDFIARAYPYYFDKQHLHETDYKIISKLFRVTSQENGWGMSEKYLFSYLNSRSPQTFAEVNSAICEAFHKQEKTDGILLWGIKAPVLIANLERIREVYPTAKIIHLVRDGRDVYLSYKKIHETNQIKFGPRGVVENALYWIDGLRRVENFRKNNQNHQIYELRYDDLLENPSRELTKLCEYLDIQYVPSMHDNFNSIKINKKVAPSHFRETIHAKLTSGIDSKNTRKYKRGMSTAEKIAFELIAIPYLVKYGYETDFNILRTSLLVPFRSSIYYLAKQINNLRYARRDRHRYNSMES